MVVYFASRDLVPLYSIYALLFSDRGLSLAQVSWLFVIWSLTAFVFEVPSGAWADAVDRRTLLVLSAGVYALAFSCWMVVPTFTGFATGFVLWGLSSAMMSGTFESLLYDELDDLGAASHFAQLYGWCQSTAMVANLVGSVAAAPLFAVGGYALVGWTSVAMAGVQGLLAVSLPVAPRRPERAGEDGVDATEDVDNADLGLPASATFIDRYVSMLRVGLREAVTSVDVRRVVIVSSVLVGLTAYDEYFALVGTHHGVPTAQVAVLVGVAVVGQAIGTVLAGRTVGMTATTMGWAVAAGGTLISAGVLMNPWVGFVAIGAGYGLLNNAMIVSEARLQESIVGVARATVTSVHGVATEVVALAVYALFALTASTLSVPTVMALLGLPVLVVAVGVRRWMPPARYPST